MLLAGVDIGSSSCKAVVYESVGCYKGKFSHTYEIQRHNHRQELSGEAIWAAVAGCLQEAFRVFPEIEAVAVTSFGESFVLLDKQDNTLWPVMLYSDLRGSEQAAKMRKDFSADEIASITGSAIHYMFSLPKLLWIKDNCPDVFLQTRKIMLIQDYIVYRLSGVAQMDYSLAARTLAFSIREKKWDAGILGYAGIDAELLSQPVLSGTIAGNLREDLAAAWFVKQEVQIVSGCHDQVAAAVGAGVFQAGTAVDGTGTVECITPLVSDVPDLQVLTRGGISVVPYAVPNQYVCYAFSFVGGALIKWYCDNFTLKEQMQTQKNGCDIYSILEENLDFAPGDLLVLPHFNGAATPYMDGDAKGAILGLTLEHTGKDIYKALMEGVSYEMLLNLYYLADAGIEINSLHATGGGAKSAFWLQFNANVLGKKVITMQTEEAGTAGSAMLASVAMGCYADLEAAGKAFAHMQKCYEPEWKYTEIYKEKYQRYQALYKTLKAFR